MRDKGRNRKLCRKCRWGLGVLMLGLLVGGLHFLHKNMSVQAAETDEYAMENSFFDVEVETLASEGDTYNISLKVKNVGADWEGTVRVSVDETYRVPSAYDTAISLPQGSEKQFVVKVPKGASESTDGSVKVMLLDKKSNLVAQKTFKRFLTDEMDCLSMGILSDEYASLTYLDMGGSNLYYYGSYFPVKLVELQQENFTDSLDALTFLVIDKYNTDVLTDEEKKALSLWIDNGGVMLVGTGEYAEEVLEGLQDILPAIKCRGIVEPDVSSNDLDYDSMDVQQLTLAQFQVDTNQYYESYFCSGVIAGLGDGAVGVVPFSFVELGKAPDTIYSDMTQEEAVLNILEEVSSTSNSRYLSNTSTTNVFDRMSLMRRMMGILGNCSNSLHFGVLKFLVILYVIFVGPVLYLILRFTKKREWYWVAVPVTAFVGILVIFFAGRGFEVVSTKVYSVTTQDVSGKENSTSYLYCYDANYREWNLKLGEDYEYVGPLNNENYNYMSDDDDLSYYHHMQNEGGTLRFGIKPSSAFEDCYFYAGKTKGSLDALGSIGISKVNSDWSGISGEITNDTGEDFLYYAVIAEDILYVYKNLPAGGTVSLGQETYLYHSTSSQGFNMRSNYINDFLRDIYDDTEKEDVAALAALGVGIYEAYAQSDSDVVVVCGVVADWDKVVDDDCSEISYGCLYKVQ